MIRRTLVLLLVAAGWNSLPAESKTQNWQTGQVAGIQKPEAGRHPGWGTIGPQVTKSEETIMLESSSFGATWAIAIYRPDGTYVVTLPPPPRKSWLGQITPGSPIECAVEGKRMYLRDKQGKVFRARIRSQSTR